ncbi:unnamed protein product [Moneuplotes crassus]|uniref:Uncharacterized protein n=1 Tax=Euplotes crassus TaxID=5936 RepID=A0AAD1U904_EUPCR|nr:unnamed protein product [Moneuplotes crassus]
MEPQTYIIARSISEVNDVSACNHEALCESTGEESNSSVELTEILKNTFLLTILSKIFTDSVIDSLWMTSLSPLMEESQEILENEINTWLSQLETIYPETTRRIAFKRPDYDEAKFYTFKYELEAGKIMVKDIADGLKNDFKLEHSFLNSINQSLIKLLNNKGDLSCIFPGINNSTEKSLSPKISESSDEPNEAAPTLKERLEQEEEKVPYFSNLNRKHSSEFSQFSSSSSSSESDDDLMSTDLLFQLENEKNPSNKKETKNHLKKLCKTDPILKNFVLDLETLMRENYIQKVREADFYRKGYRKLQEQRNTYKKKVEISNGLLKQTIRHYQDLCQVNSAKSFCDQNTQTSELVEESEVHKDKPKKRKKRKNKKKGQDSSDPNSKGIQALIGDDCDCRTIFAILEQSYEDFIEEDGEEIFDC